MRMKTFTSALTALTMAVFCGVSAANAGFDTLPDRGDENKLTDMGYSYISPKMTIDNIVVDDLNEARGKIVTLHLTLSGNNIDRNYCSTGFHIYWDERLKPIAYSNGKYAKAGSAVEGLNFTTENIDSYGAFVMTTGSADYGMSGDIAVFRLMIPYDAETGDVYPIDIAYRESEYRKDLFTNKDDNEQGRQMQNSLFRHGIYSSVNPNYTYIGGQMLDHADGYIYVNTTTTTTTETTTTTTTTTETTTTTTTTTETTTTTTTTEQETTATTTEFVPVEPEYMLGDVNGDNMVDARDAAALLRNYAFTSVGGSIDRAVFLASDVNSDYVADGRDAAFIFTYYAKASAGKAGSFEDYARLFRW